MIRATIVLAFVAVVAQTQTPPQDPAASPTPSPSPSPKGLDVLWRADLKPAEERNATASLVSGRAHVFISEPGAGVTAFDTTERREAWTFPDAPVVPPAVAGNNVAIATADALTVVNEETGQMRWQVPLEGGGAPICVFGSADRVAVLREGDLQVWDAAGKPAWRATLANKPVTNVVPSGNLLIIGTDAPSLEAFDAVAGTSPWKIGLPAKPGMLVATSDRVYLGGDNGALYSFKTTGEPKWAWRQLRVRAIGQPIVDSRLAYFTLLDNTIYAFAANGGAQQWSHVLESKPLAGPLKLGATLAVALSNGRVEEVSAKDGKPIAAAKSAVGPTVRLLSAAAAIDGSRIYTITIAKDNSRALVVWGHADAADPKR